MQAFHDFDRELMARLCKGMHFRHAPAGTVVCEEDERGDSMFVVLAGRCVVRAEPPPSRPHRSPDRTLAGRDAAAAAGTGPRTSGVAAKKTAADASQLALAADVAGKAPEERADNDAAAASAPRLLQTHGSGHWIEQFMATAVQTHDPEVAGHGNAITPLAAVVAAKWRRSLADAQAEEARRRAAQEASEREGRERSEGIAALLGKAAALNWRQATFGGRAADASAPDGEGPVDWRSLSRQLRDEKAAVEVAAEQAKLTVAAQDAIEADAAVTVAADARDGTCESAADLAGAARQERGARLYNPTKQHLAALGARAPTTVSTKLRSELMHRASIDTVLKGMDRLVQRQGAARRLGQHDSRRITRALNRSMLQGASRQVCPRPRLAARA